MESTALYIPWSSPTVRMAWVSLPEEGISLDNEEGKFKKTQNAEHRGTGEHRFFKYEESRICFRGCALLIAEQHQQQNRCRQKNKTKKTPADCQSFKIPGKTGEYSIFYCKWKCLFLWFLISAFTSSFFHFSPSKKDPILRNIFRRGHFCLLYSFFLWVRVF